jgi:hypothetical protein
MPRHKPSAGKNKGPLSDPSTALGLLSLALVVLSLIAPLPGSPTWILACRVLLWLAVGLLLTRAAWRTAKPYLRRRDGQR